MEEYRTTINHNYSLQVKAPVKTVVVIWVGVFGLSMARHYIRQQMEHLAEFASSLDTRKHETGTRQTLEDNADGQA